MLSDLIKNFIFDAAAHIFPLLAKKIYPQSKYVEHIRISAGSTTPLIFSLSGGNSCPEASIWLKITNLSPYLDTEIKQVEITLLVAGTSIIKRYRLPFYDIIPHSSEKEVYILQQLNYFQVETLKKFKKKPEAKATIQVELTLSSSLYTVRKLEILQNVHYEIEGYDG